MDENTAKLIGGAGADDGDIKSSLLDNGEEQLKGLRCRVNSMRGETNPANRSYPPVGSVLRALSVLRTVNKQHIATVNGIFLETGIPKPTIVRMLETLMVEGYISRDNMCGGYRVTAQVSDLNSGYEGVSRTIEMSRLPAIELTRRIKWPVGLGVVEAEAISIHFWTGAISPWTHTNAVLGAKPNLKTTSMGRAYLAFCGEDILEKHLIEFRESSRFDEFEERNLCVILERVRKVGYAIRDPRTKPYNTTTIAMPVLEENQVRALINISFFTSAVAPGDIKETIISPLLDAKNKIEDAFACTNSHFGPEENLETEGLEFGF